jgi:hypothetical protein
MQRPRARQPQRPCSALPPTTTSGCGPIVICSSFDVGRGAVGDVHAANNAAVSNRMSV